MSNSPLSSFTLAKRFKPQVNHLEALLEMLPYPALLLDKRSERILIINGRLIELTAFTRTEMNGRPLTALLPTFSELLFHPQPEAYPTTLLHRSGRGVDVFARISSLEEHLIVITVESVKQREEEQEKQTKHTNHLKAFGLLAQAFQQPDLQPAYEMALQAGSLLLGTEIIALYQANGPEFQLQQQAVYGPAEFLPRQLPAQEMLLLKTPLVWHPQKRALSGLHRSARAVKLAMVASAPLGEPNALIGVVVAAGERARDREESLLLINILATSITNLFQAHTRAANLSEQILSHSKEASLANTVMEAMYEGIVSLSADLRIIALNSAAEAILGYASREVEGQYHQHILIGADHLIPAFLPENSESQEYTLKNVRLYRRDGSSFLANIRSIPVAFQGKLSHLAVLIQDLSQEEQYRLRNQQLEQRALIGEVSAIFAHEVRNPINNISTGLQLMAFNLSENDPNQAIIARLQNDCERLEELMKSTLAFVKPMEYKMEPMALQDTLPRLLERWRAHMARVNIQYILHIDPETPSILGDQRALDQVWNNLISNAIQAMGKDGGSLIVKIRPITTPENLPYVEIVITDTGTGISSEARDRIFEPFFTTRSSGTGLGLPIAKHIITAHRGSIKVTSIPGGTSFQIYLPTANTQ
jgi:PAS domain S-box-containing protein